MDAPSCNADIVIIGTGMAGVTLARELRKFDQDATIHMITSDDGQVYSKPMISNAFAQGKSPDTLVQKTAQQMAEDLNVRVWTHTQVQSIDRAARSLHMDGPGGGRIIGYGDLVLATGATPRPFEVEGSTSVSLPAVNSLTDYARWRAGLTEDARVLIVGAGLIGLEFANDLVNVGYRVEVVDPMAKPLGRLLPDKLGRIMQDALTDIGVTFHMGTTVTGIAPSVNGNVARLANGERIAFDHALSAIGLLPNTGLAQDAGLTVKRGIRVDAYLRTSDAHIYALGDCAETDAGVLPFILPLMAEARALAKTLTGAPAPVDLPALPVAVKTPALPTVVCPPAPGAKGDWIVEGDGHDRRALFVSPDGEELGFVLTGTETKARQTLAKEMPRLLAA